MTNSEKLLSSFSEDFFYKELVYADLKFVPEGGTEIELADLIINLEDVILAIQLKERNERDRTQDKNVEEKSAIDDKKSAVDRIKSAIEQQKYNEPSKANILKVYDEIEKNQIFGTKEIKEILDCSPSTARAVMTKLRDMKVVKAVNGKGKGKYVFIE